MPISLLGLSYAGVASVSWGSALVFAKLPIIKHLQISVWVITLSYSIGYFITAALAVLVAYLNGKSVAWTNYGFAGGIFWGSGKIFSLQAISGAIGLAAGQSTQCVVSCIVAFTVGVFAHHEPVSVMQCLGLLMLIAGLVTISLAKVPVGAQANSSSLEARLTGCSLTPVSTRSIVDTSIHTAEAMTPQSSEGSKPTAAIFQGICLAVAAGLTLGCQNVPYLFDPAANAWDYTASQSVGQLSVILIVCGTVVIQQRRTSASPALSESAIGHDRVKTVVVGGLAGLCGGSLLFVAAFANTQACGQLGLAMGQSLSQTNMVVASLWGVFLFNEIVGLRLLCWFGLGCMVALTGAVMIAL